MIVLMPHCGFLSETTRMLHIAQALRAIGEDVALATHGGPYTRILDEAKFPYELLSPEMDTERCARYVADVVRLGKPGIRLQSAEEVRQGVAAEAAFLRRVKAEIVVIGFTLTAYLSSRVAGIPLVTSHGGSYVPPVFERRLAPVPTTMPIPGTEWLPRWLKRLLANTGPTRLTRPLRFLNEIAAELGVEPVPSVAALMLGELTLVTDVPEVLGVPRAELEAWHPPRSSPSSPYRADTRLVYVGPLFARLDPPIPPAVEAFLERPRTRPTAYVVLSSSTPQQLREVVASVRRAGARVIVGATIHDFGPSDDPDVVVGGILPSHRIMPRVDVAVTMGGQGTVQTAMTSGVPLVAIPLQPEQELNVDLAVRRGMAFAVAPRHAGGPRMTDAVRRALADASVGAAAQRVAALYAGIDGARGAASAIRAYLGRSARSEPDRLESKVAE